MYRRSTVLSGIRLEFRTVRNLNEVPETPLRARIRIESVRRHGVYSLCSAKTNGVEQTLTFIKNPESQKRFKVRRSEVFRDYWLRVGC